MVATPLKKFLLVAGCAVCVLSACSLFESDEQKADKAFNQALQAIEANKTDEAFIHLKNVVQLQPGHAKAHYRMGTLYIEKREQLGQGVQELRIALEEQPDFGPARRYLADLMYSNRYFKEAAEHYATLADQEQPKLENLLRLGDARMRSEQQEAGVGAFKRAVELYPEAPEPRMAYASALAGTGQQEQAVEALQQAKAALPENVNLRVMLIQLYMRLEESAKAEAEVETLVEEVPETAAAHLTAARYYLGQNRSEKAEQVLSQGLARGVDSPRLLQGLGLVAHIRGDQESALEWFRRAAEAHPEDQRSLLLLADYYLFQNKPDKAIDTYERMVAKWPALKPVKARIARLLLNERQEGEAQERIENLLQEDPEYAPGHILKGIALQSKGEADKALDAFARARELEPESAQSRYFYGLSLLEQEEYDLSLSEILKALEKNPDSPRLRFVLAYIYFKTDQLDQALTEVTQVLSQSPDDLRARELRATIRARLGRFDAAEEDYRTLLEAIPDNPRARMRLALVQQQQGKYEAALDHLQAALDGHEHPLEVLERIVAIHVAQENFDQASHILEDQIQVQPQEIRLKLMKASLLLRQGSIGRARTYLGQVSQAHPDSELPHLLLAEIALRSGDLDSSTAALKRAISVNPSNGVPYLRLARIYASQEQWDRAIATYEELLQVKPDHGPALNDLAYLYALQGKQLDKAMELAKQARQAMPGNPDVLDTMGYVAQQKGASATAQRYFREAIELQPERPVFHFHLGQAQFDEQELSAAEQSLHQALELGLEGEMKTEAQDLLARIEEASDVRAEVRKALDMGRLEEALELAKAARDQAPKDPEIAFLLGKIYQEKGSSLMAVRYYREAVEGEPDKSGYQFALGMSLFRDEQPNEARRHLERALELGLDQTKATKVRQTLAQLSE